MNGGAERGLQAERTVLAHWRTALATTVAALLVVRSSTPGPERAIVVAATVIAVVTVAVVGYRRQQALVAGRTGASPRTVLAVAGAVVALQVAAVAVLV